MGCIVSSAATCVTCLACQCASTVCTALLGNTSPGTTGRKRSIFLLALSVALSLTLQYSWANSFVDSGITTWWRNIPWIGSAIQNSFSEGCNFDEVNDPKLAHHYRVKCVGNGGVCRVNGASFVFFMFMAGATYVRPSLNREHWPIKYAFFLAMVFLSFVISNEPLYFDIYLPVARVGASIFLVIQQIILIDLAYSWNDSWVARSETHGEGWLVAIVGCIGAFYLACLVTFILLYKHFTGCGTNNFLIILTNLLVIAVTTIQVMGDEGNLLTSAVMSIYSVYLLISSISHNPNAHCNPRLESNDTFGIVVGIALTFVSLVWTGWSWTDDRILTTGGMTTDQTARAEDDTEKTLDNLHIPLIEQQTNDVTGLVVERSILEEDSSTNGGSSMNEICKLNIVLALISCWITVTLTGWGSIRNQAGTVNVWFIIISQWVALGLYVWTLVAPRIFPDRDFN